MFSDYICPFCFIGSTVIERAKEELAQSGIQLEVKWKPYELRPEGSGIPQPSTEYLNNAWQNVYRLAKDYDISIRRPLVRISSRIVLEAAEFARENKKFEEFHNLAFNGYFLDDKDISSPIFLSATMRKIGLSYGEFKKRVSSSYYDEPLKKSRIEAERYMVTGVPTFIAGKRIVVGAQPQEIIVSAVAETIC